MMFEQAEEQNELPCELSSDRMELEKEALSIISSLSDEQLTKIMEEMK